MSTRVYRADGTLTHTWDDTVRTVTDHLTGQSRPYTTEENAAADAAGEAARTATNESTLRVDAAAQLAVLLASIDTLQAVTDKANNQLGPADTKTVARETRRVARQLVRLTRLIVGALETVDAGPE